MAKIVIGVMGPGAEATKSDEETAYQIGKLIAKEDWVLLSGGRNDGVMDAVSKGAKSVNGLVVGILPTGDRDTFSEYLDIEIITEMKSARNNINVLSSNVVVACGMGAGTASEVAMAIKANKKIILINQDETSKKFFEKIGKDLITFVDKPEEVIVEIKKLLL
jgi:hypothetical protein